MAFHSKDGQETTLPHLMHPKIYEKYGLSKDALEKYWTSKSKNKQRELLKGLIRSRINDGIESGLKDHKIWWAIDLAYDTPFSQLTPTLVKDIMSKNSFKTTAEVLDVLKRWNVDLNQIIRERVMTDGSKSVVIDVPMFFQIVVPLVKSYVTIRRAKLFNDRNLFPFMKFEPIKFTLQNRLIGEILTDIVQGISQSYGYPTVLRQAILQALQYGTCLMFPLEEWHCDKQIQMIGGKEKEQCVKEGLRYTMPHPTRFFWDKNHRISTYNTDSGCEFGGYWRVDRYSTIEDNQDYWNKDSILVNGQERFFNENRTYFEEVSPCTLTFPKSESGGAGVGDRERDVVNYSTDQRDSAVFKTEMFMKLVPKDWGMGDYPYQTWMRFVVAGTDTVIWNAPISYCPVIYFGYDADESRTRNSSMSLEILPFQDHFGILLSQYIYSVKQNLSKVVFWDSDQVEQTAVDQIENLGAARITGVPFVPFSGRKNKLAGQDRGQAFLPVSFPVLDVSSVATAMTTMLSILERVLVLASQEIGQAATHEQTAEETRLIAVNTSTRVTFTGSFIDDGIDAWKRQLYYASKANMDDDITAQVSINVEGSKDVLKELGYDVEDESGSDTDGRVKAVVKGKMSRLTLDAFISTREGESRINGPAIAGAMSNLLQVAMGNPVTAQAIGAQQALELITEIGKLAGMPKEFQLKVAKGFKEAGPEGQMQEAQNQLKQMSEEITKQSVQIVAKEIGEPLAEQIKQTNDAVAQAGQIATQTKDEADETAQALASLIQKLEPVLQAMEASAGMAPPNAIDNQEPALV